MPDKKNTIGRFEILEKIGEGPIGAVYKALDPVIRRTVAIKVIKLYALEETTTFAEVFEKIYRVVRASTSLNHPNICIIYDLSEEKKIPYITMEYVEGHDLETLLQKKHQFKRAELLNILQQICDALDFAHRKNVIHQDLKATNILLTPDLNVKITDFGIAGLDEIAAAQTKKLLSIPFYISPEQALGEKVAAASDLFSLGVIIYYLLCGQLPFPGTTAANAIMMIARDNPESPPQLEKSGISRDDWDSFFGIALAKAPGSRFRSAREMYEAVSAILPASDQAYYPYTFSEFRGDSTGKMEKTYVGEASPTVLIEPSKILEESMAPVPVEAPVGASVEGAAPVKAQEKPPAAPLKPKIPPPTPTAPEPSAAKTVLVTQEELMEERETVLVSPPVAETIPPQLKPTEMIQLPPEQVTEPVPTPEQETEPVAVVPAVPPTELISVTPEMVTPPPSPPPAAPAAAPTQLVTVPEPTPPAASKPQPVPTKPASVAQQVAPVTKAVAAPNLRRYFIGALVIAGFILIASAIFFWKLQKPEISQPQQAAPTQPTTPQPGTVTVPPAATTVSGKISITSEPAGATVFLGEEQKGVTPLEVADLALGKYTIKLQLKDYADSVQEVELTKENPVLSVPVTLEKQSPVVGTLVIESEPSEAIIVIGNRVIGVTPKTLPKTNAGKYKITLRKEGYEEYSTTLRVLQDKTATLHAQLVEIPKPPPPPEEVKPKVPEVKPGQLVTLGPGVVPPKAVKRTFAKYPEAAKARKIQGVVSMSALVSETGSILEVKVIKSAHPMLDEAAVKAVKEWIYEPATKDGVPVKVWIPVSMSFQSAR